MDLDAVADELYALPPSEFVAARGKRSKQARAEGDAGLAAAITKLRKPTVGAWLANLLVRERADDVGRLIELGGQLRAAQRELAGDTLRTLSTRRRESITALRAAGLALGRRAGVPVGEAAAGELEATLEASVADPDAADTLCAGRLASALHYAGTGFDGLALDVASAPARTRHAAATNTQGAAKTATSKAPAAANRAGPKAAKHTAETAAKHKAEQAELREAGSAEKASARRVTAARKKVDDARGRLGAARTALERARSELDKLEREATACDVRVADANRLLHKAEAEHKAAGRRVEQLQGRRTRG